MSLLKKIFSSFKKIVNGKPKTRKVKKTKKALKKPRKRNVSRKTRSAKSYKPKKGSTAKKKAAKKTVKKKTKRKTAAKKKKVVKKATKKKIAKKTVKRKSSLKTRVSGTRKKSTVKKQKSKTTKKLAKDKGANGDPGLLVGEITHYFNKISVCVLKVKRDKIRVGDRICISGNGRNFTQTIKSLQVESVDVKSAKKGQLVGLKTQKPAKEGDQVYRIKV